jgi:hypothetical protein
MMSDTIVMWIELRDASIFPRERRVLTLSFVHSLELSESFHKILGYEYISWLVAFPLLINKDMSNANSTTQIPSSSSRFSSLQIDKLLHN